MPVSWINAEAFEGLARQMPGHAHLDAERLRLVRARNHAAVVVGENHHRLAEQLRLKQTLARGIEVVAVDQGEGAAHEKSRIERRTTPQTSKPRSAVTTIAGYLGLSAFSKMSRPR